MGSADWNETLDDLANRTAAARSMGGDERVQKHRAKGKFDARQRVAHLLDDGSFQEIGTLVGAVASDGVVTGHGLVDGRPVMIGAEDFTTLGGSIGSGSSAKRYRIAELAERERVPLIMLLEGAGHRPPLPSEPKSGRSPIDLQQQARLSGKVPIITGVMGASAGHGALIAPLSDFSIMTTHGAIFTAGPPVVKESLGEDITKEDLGGPAVAVGSGLIHNVAADDAAALDDIRRYLSYFGSSAWSYPPSAQGGDHGERRLDAILDVVPRDNAAVYDMRHVVSLLVDDGALFQVQPDFGTAMVCALARIGGNPVAVIANQPAVLAGSIDVDAADKAAHFISVADAFHLPLVFLADNPGVLAGSRSEQAGILRSGARMFAAQSLARSPKVQVTLRKAYGFGSMVMAMTGFDGQTISAGFPGATLGAMGAKGSSRAIGADVEEAAAIAAAEQDAAYRSAGGLGFDELIDPRELRNVILRSLRLALNRRQVPAEPRSATHVTP